MCEERKWKKDIHIQLANMKYTDSCIEILQNSDLGRVYFSDYEKVANMLTYAVGQENIYVALDENEKCLGFIYYMTNGVFGSYPYLHIVAVKEEYRNYGIVKQFGLLDSMKNVMLGDRLFGRVKKSEFIVFDCTSRENELRNINWDKNIKKAYEKGYEFFDE